MIIMRHTLRNLNTTSRVMLNIDGNKYTPKTIMNVTDRKNLISIPFCNQNTYFMDSKIHFSYLFLSAAEKRF